MRKSRSKLTVVKIIIPICLSIFAVIVGLGIYQDYLLSLNCAYIYPLIPKVSGREKLLACSSVEQHIDWDCSHNVIRLPSDVEGWDVLTPADPELPARLCVVAVRNRNDVIWYPRLSGTESSIDLLVVDRVHLRLLDHIAGGESWSPIGMQHILDFRCLTYGQLKGKDIPERLIFQLLGRWTQVWVKNEAVFF